MAVSVSPDPPGPVIGYGLSPVTGVIFTRAVPSSLMLVMLAYYPVVCISHNNIKMYFEIAAKHLLILWRCFHSMAPHINFKVVMLVCI